MILYNIILFIYIIRTLFYQIIFNLQDGTDKFSIVLCTLHTPLCKLHSPLCTLHTPHCSLHTPPWSRIDCRWNLHCRPEPRSQEPPDTEPLLCYSTTLYWAILCYTRFLMLQLASISMNSVQYTKLDIPASTSSIRFLAHSDLPRRLFYYN